MEELKKIVIADQIKVTIPACFENNLDKQWMVDPSMKEKILENTYFKTAEEDVELNFIYMDERLKAQNMEGSIQNLYNVLSRLAPGFKRIQVLRSEINGMETGAIQYKSNALTYDLYNLYVIYNLKNKKFAFHAYCKADLGEKWQSTFFKIAESVKNII